LLYSTGKRILWTKQHSAQESCAVRQCSRAPQHISQVNTDISKDSVFTTGHDHTHSTNGPRCDSLSSLFEVCEMFAQVIETTESDQGL
jgi:hypothetical protein